MTNTFGDALRMTERAVHLIKSFFGYSSAVERVFVHTPYPPSIAITIRRTALATMFPDFINKAEIWNVHPLVHPKRLSTEESI